MTHSHNPFLYVYHMPTAPIVCCHVLCIVHDHGALARRCACALGAIVRAWCGCASATTMEPTHLPLAVR